VARFIANWKLAKKLHQKAGYFGGWPPQTQLTRTWYGGIERHDGTQSPSKEVLIAFLPPISKICSLAEHGLENLTGKGNYVVENDEADHRPYGQFYVFRILEPFHILAIESMNGFCGMEEQRATIGS
jgi:hypothetical protein